LCDWQIPDFLDEIDLDAEEYIASLPRMNVGALTFVCKSAFGSCLYPSKAGYINPSMVNGDVAAASVASLGNAGSGSSRTPTCSSTQPWVISAIHEEVRATSLASDVHEGPGIIGERPQQMVRRGRPEIYHLKLAMALFARRNQLK